MNWAKTFYFHGINSSIVARRKATHVADVLLEGRPFALPHVLSVGIYCHNLSSMNELLNTEVVVETA
jgi:hypothetical protein